MTEQEYHKEILKGTIEAINKAYENGYDNACENIIAGIKLVPTTVIAKEHVIKLINIIQKVSKKHENLSNTLYFTVFHSFSLWNTPTNYCIFNT